VIIIGVDFPLSMQACCLEKGKRCEALFFFSCSWSLKIFTDAWKSCTLSYSLADHKLPYQ
jgi:hypothetical protein